ncbi:imidazole glycerol phosphate synthase subunit HisH [Polynucleobacter paneuropaeus]|nr:imidazole glycerol phosphate synthase subunit HisH [Polynucleobacter paneuropaeus]
MSAVGIVDVGIGNLGSLKSAIHELGFETLLVNDKSNLANCDSLILPGVGSFGHGVGALREASLDKAICEFAALGKPVLGICLGMQLLFAAGEEGGVSRGLSLIPGSVKRFPESIDLQIPHVGWNEVRLTKPHPLWTGIKTDVDFYFVHSYRVECDPAYANGLTNYGADFPSFVARENVVGVQFHPEKSQRNGLRLLENFCLWNGRC